MTPRELAAHKSAYKKLTVMPSFRPMKKGRLPKPFHKIGSARLKASSLLRVSSDHQVFFCWRTGETIADASFYGYLLCDLPNDTLGVVFEFHWHPSHNGIHCKLPCRTPLDYTNRLLVGAPELALSGSTRLDPREDADRQELILLFCKACGFRLVANDDPDQPELWNC
jgi:hypothetical protein